MNAKLKGLFKGLRYISSIFEEEKEQEIVIGLPTDVKHVAHIGWEGPPGGGGPSASAVEASPSWMKEFPASEGVTQSLPPNVGGINPNVGGIKENREILLDTENSKFKSSSKDSGEMAKSTKRHPKESSEHTHNNTTRRAPKELHENTHSNTTRRVPKELHENTHNTNSPKREKPRNSRRRSAKETSENGSSSNKQLQIQDATLGAASSPSRNTTEVPRRHRRKKSKENQLDGEIGGSGSGRSSRSKGKRQGVDLHGLDDRQSSLNSVVSNDSPLRTFSKEDKQYRQVS